MTLTLLGLSATSTLASVYDSANQHLVEALAVHNRRRDEHSAAEADVPAKQRGRVFSRVDCRHGPLLHASTRLVGLGRSFGAQSCRHPLHYRGDI